MISELTSKEVKVFTRNFRELQEFVRLYGLPSNESMFVTEKMMFYRLRGIKIRPELLELAKKLDTKGIIF